MNVIYHMLQLDFGQVSLTTQYSSKKLLPLFESLLIPSLAISYSAHEDQR